MYQSRQFIYEKNEALQQQLVQQEQQVKVHILPCTINQNGDADVNQFFTPLIKYDQANNMEVTLHGRKLNGTSTKIPNNNKLIILSQNQDGLRLIDVQDKVAYWKYDEPIQQNDMNMQILNFCTVLDALHLPIQLPQK